MDKRMTKAEFCELANKQEDIKRKWKALREWQEKQDIQAVESGRSYRVGKHMNVI
jgi:predicted nucleotide-binding protein (sugar kinase/HSP70/actin superfamily)